jgi:8-oxo-dGTP pyrophosphatase MutT (NUDIX family)
MGYIAELRQLVGQRPIILVGAAALVNDIHGSLLMNFRPDNHTWGIPGGAMEPGESLEETARRETQEETGLVLGEIRLFGVFSGPEFYYRYPHGDEVYNATIVYTCHDFSGVLDESNEESLKLRFFSPSEIDLAQVSPPVRPIINLWLSSSTLPLSSLP